MKQSIAGLALPVVAVLVVAGCTSPTPPPEGGTASSASITSAPNGAEPNSKATVCWRVEGTGTIPHVAVHHDTESHPNATSFTEYRGGASYPDNATREADNGYALPGTFCTGIPVGTSTVYFRAHALDRNGPPGKLSQEHSIQVRPVMAPAVIAAVILRDTPSNATAAGPVSVCWEVQGSGKIAHTALHTDTVTHATATSFTDYRGATYYPNNTASQAAEGYTLPGSWCANVTMPQNGTLYIRGHAMDSPPGVLSATERAIAVNNTTTPMGVVTTIAWVGSLPTSASAGSNVTACWRVEGTGSIPHTAIHTDDESHPLPTAEFDDYDKQAYYPNNATSAVTVHIPATFCTAVGVPGPVGSTVFLRAHAIDSTGGKGKLSLDEKAIQATA